MKMERIVKRFYDSLEEGKVEGRRCKDCGAVEFPPVIACNACGSTNVEWFETSGQAKMTTFFMPGMMTAQPQNKDLEPYCYGVVELEGGAPFNTLVCGVTNENKDEIDLPAPVKVKIVQRDGFKAIVYELVK